MTSLLSPPPVGTDPVRVRQGPAGRPHPVLVVVALLGVIAAVLAGIAYLGRQPAEGSVDVGFARDMSEHHAQAVSMSETVRDRTNSPEIRILAADIALTQQTQIGMMQAWLAEWGASPSSAGPRMAWMGASTTRLMPGMASEEERSALRSLPADEADIRFLQLMIPHHRGALEMASYAAANAGEPQVRALGRGIVAAQTAEIDYLNSLLAKRGLPAVAGPTSDAAVGIAQHGGSSQRGGGSPSREDWLLTVVAVGIFALAWLALAHLPNKAPPAGRLWLVVAAGGSVLAGAVHLVLTPEHSAERAAYGAFFLVAAVLGLLAAAAIAAGHAQAGLASGAALSAFLAVVWALFRVVAPPGGPGPEPVTVAGVITVTAELAVLSAAVAWWHRQRQSAT